MNPFEERLTGGRATYIRSHSYSPESCSFEMIVFHDPDSPRHFRILRATGIEFYGDLPHDLGESDFLESIIGAEQFSRHDGKLITIFHTDHRGITITASEVTLEEITSDKP